MKKWDAVTKFLHFCLAIAVSSQLLTSQIMTFPDKKATNDALGKLFFEIHEYTGLAALLIVSLHFLWIFSYKSLHINAYFPWNSQGYASLRQDLEGLKSSRLPAGGPGSGGLVGLVHGLGLLGVLLAASLGGFIYLTLHQIAISHATQTLLIQAHQFVATCVLVFWFGHVGMAVFHYWKGDKTLFSIFSPKSD